ncbi:MAG: spore coat protein CotJB [Firmicutes bacterium]|nr:spore coat protein CotJB [Bacillota bacterium]
MEHQFLKELAEKSFAALDLQLYIDTHPDDAAAIARYNESVRALSRLQAEYEKTIGPLYSFVSPSADTRFTWVDTAWPWEND